MTIFSLHYPGRSHQDLYTFSKSFSTHFKELLFNQIEPWKMAYFSAKQSIKSPPPPPPPLMSADFFPFYILSFFFPFKTFLRSVCPFHFWCSAYYLNALFNQTFSSIMAIFFIFMFFIDAHPPGCDRPVVCVCEGPSGCEHPRTWGFRWERQSESCAEKEAITNGSLLQSVWWWWR